MITSSSTTPFAIITPRSCSSEVSSASVASFVSLHVGRQSANVQQQVSEEDALDHVLRDAADLLLGRKVGDGLKVELRVALDETRANPLDLLPILLSRSLVLGPDEVEHALDALLRTQEVVSLFRKTRNSKKRANLGRIDAILVRDLEKVHRLEHLALDRRREEVRDGIHRAIELLDKRDGVGVVLLRKAKAG